LTRTTINKWVDYIDDKIKKIHNDKILRENRKQKIEKITPPAPKVVEAAAQPEYNVGDIKRLVIYFDKEYVEFNSVNEMLDFMEGLKTTPPAPVEKEAPKYKDKYTGLFHYSRGEVMINQHTYAGCKVIRDGKFNKEEIDKHFNKVDFLMGTEQFKNWMIHQLNYYFSGKLDSYHKNGIRDIEDTEKDVAFMTMLLKKLWNYDYEYKG
jgi:hypothetical protein